MKLSVFIFLGILLIIVHGFWPDIFLIDYITIGILLLIFLPQLATYLTKAKILGAEFEFKDKIKETEKFVQQSIEKSKKDKRFRGKKTQYLETFNTSRAKQLLSLENDNLLALASLRMEIEKKLRMMADFLNIPKKENLSLSRLVKKLDDKKIILYPEHAKALNDIIAMCNKAIHGYSVTREETEAIINLVDKINKTIPIGYSINLFPNSEYKKHGLVCEWEHCIEGMPLTEKRTKKSCRIFGHNCPGGPDRVLSCGKTIKDFPKKRFINPDRDG